MTGDPNATRLFPDSTDDSENDAAFSPDGKWIAYSATTAGTANVFVQPFPPTGFRLQISATNGRYPAWTADGRQIAFVTRDNRYMLVDVTPRDGVLAAGVPRELFTRPQGGAVSGFSIDARAERFLLVVDQAQPQGPVAQQPITVMVNWPGAVRR